jgi:hypothetical protein
LFVITVEAEEAKNDSTPTAKQFFGALETQVPYAAPLGRAAPVRIDLLQCGRSKPFPSAPWENLDAKS